MSVGLSSSGPIQNHRRVISGGEGEEREREEVEEIGSVEAQSERKRVRRGERMRRRVSATEKRGRRSLESVSTRRKGPYKVHVYKKCIYVVPILGCE